MTATSGPGLSLMMEGIGYAAITETPCVVVDVQRAGPATGQATRVGSGDILQVRYGSHGDYCPIALSPWSVQEMYDLTIRAFNLAERFRVPTFLMTEEAVGHLRETVVLHRDFEVVERDRDVSRPPFGSDRPDGVPPMPAFGDGANLMVTGSTHDAWGVRRVDHADQHTELVGRINRKVLDHAGEIVEVDARFLDDAEVAVVTYGFTGRSALAAVKALRSEGVRAGLLRLKTLWPFPAGPVGDLGGAVRAMLVPEMNLGQLAGLIRQHARCDVEGLGQVNGEVIEPHDIERRVREVLR
jgi:2-oxoglutarate ferredoxin oxidoreductase subunit alpha